MLRDLGFNYKSNLLKSRLSKAIVLRILIMSGAFSLISIILQLLSEYDYEKDRLQTSSREIAYSYADLLNLQLTQSNDAALQKTLDSIVNFESISRAVLKTKIDGGASRIKMESGHEPTDSQVLGISLLLSDGNQTFGQTSILELTSDYAVAQNKVIDKLIIIGASQITKTFVVSFFILLLIHQLVIKHITQVSNWLKQYNPKHQFIPMIDDSKSGRENEIDELKSAVCKMGRQMHKHTVSLENLISQRTIELQQRTDELEKTQQELHKVLWQKEQKLKGVSEAINDWLWDLDQFGNIVSLSTGLAELIEVTLADKAPQPLLQHLPFSDDALTKDAKSHIGQAIHAKDAFDGIQVSLITVKGEPLWLSLSASPYFSKSGEFLGYHGSATDITQTKFLEKLAYTDNLTGVANRVAYFHQADKELNRARRLNYDIGVMILDLDHFKQINDNYGHEAGDQVLRDVAKAMSQCLREEDCLGRIGGEEFALIIPGADPQGLEQVAQRLQLAVKGLGFQFLEQNKTVTMSLGFTLIEPTESFKSALKRADAFLYQAKASGRDRFVTDASTLTDYVI